MHKRHQRDQAEGLRRLLGSRGLQVLRLNSARRGAGKTSCAVNLAAAVAGQGRQVLIIDENNDPGNVAFCLGQPVQREFLDVVRGQLSLETSIWRSGDISCLTAASGIAELALLSTERRVRLNQALATASLPFDTVILDTVAGSSSRLLSLALADHAEILVVDGSAAAITDAYAFIKGASAEYGKRRYQVLMTKVRNERQAQALFRNMAGAAQRYLGVELLLLGLVAADENIKRAIHLGQPLHKAFPDAPSTVIFRELGQTIAAWPQFPPAGSMADLMHGLVRCNTGIGDMNEKEPPSAWHAPRDIGVMRTRSTLRENAIA